MSKILDYYIEKIEAAISKPITRWNDYYCVDDKTFKTIQLLVKHYRDRIKSHELIDIYDRVTDPSFLAKPNPKFDTGYGTRIY